MTAREPIERLAGEMAAALVQMVAEDGHEGQFTVEGPYRQHGNYVCIVRDNREPRRFLKVEASALMLSWMGADRRVGQ